MDFNKTNDKKYNTIKLFCFFFYSAYSVADIKYIIDGISGENKSNVEIYLQALDIPKQAENNDYLDEVKKSAKSALSVFGYYQPEINTSVSGEAPQQSVTLEVELGPQTLITSSDIQVFGEGKDTAFFNDLLDSFSLSKDMVLKHVNYESAKSSLKSLARRYGYFDSKFTKSKVEVTSLNNSASVVIWFDTGPRYQFGELVFTEILPVDKYVESLKNFNIGDPYDARKLSEFNADLSQTGYFKSITILPEFANKQDLQIPLQVLATMRPEDSFTSGLGYSTDEGVRGKFGWTRPWVNQYGHSVEGNLVASIPEQEASVVYKIPLEDPLYNYMSLQYGYKMLDQNDTDTTQYIIGANRYWRLENDWIRSIFIRYDHEKGQQGQQDFRNALIIPGISYSRTRSRGGINTTWGDRLLGSFEVANEWWLSSDDLIKVYGESKILRTYNGHQFVASAELGAIQTDSIYSVPSSMRFLQVETKVCVALIMKASHLKMTMAF
ncbi:autotransporter assembly complex protein TamA [Psychromonas sp. KJ10-10]|uniref:autotransporter assembly complex protein TamA n=1 Tax=Psychromonas sp. KJ10-10 TaxID=3391823 RepID=UPI0039B60FDD